MGDDDAASTDEPTAAVDSYVRAQCAAILQGEPELREGVDHVHPTRVAIRRLRSTMRVFAPVFDPAARLGLEPELAWYAALLGEVRDREVQRARLADAVAALPAELVLGPVAAHIDDELRSELNEHHRHLVAALDDQRYAALRAAVVELAARPPYQTVPTTDLLMRRTKSARRKAKHRLATAVTTTDADALHRARKASKRARYAAELVTPLSSKADRWVSHLKDVQDALGAHQDSVLSSRLLYELGRTAGTRQGHNGFTYGLLFAEQQQVARESRERAATL
jgi:CHAD domain-containing protein